MIKRWLVRLLSVLIVLLLLSFAVIAVILDTNWSLQQISKFLPDNIKIEKMTGTILQGFTVNGIYYEDDMLIATVNSAKLTWQADKLWQSQVLIEQLMVSDVKIQLKPSTNTEKPIDTNAKSPIELPNLQLPLAITLIIQHLQIDQTQLIFADNTAFELNQAKLIAQWQTTADIKIETLDLIAPQGNLNLTGWVQPWQGYPLNLELKAEINPPYQLQSKFNITGDLAKLTIDNQTMGDIQLETMTKVSQVLTPELHWQTQIMLKQFNPKTFLKDFDPIFINATIQAQGDLSQFQTSLQSQLREGPVYQTPWDIELKAQGLWQQIQLQQLNISQPNTEFKVKLQGDVDIRQRQPQFALNLDWDNIKYQALQYSKGQASLKGTPEQYQLSLNTDIHSDIINQSHWQLQATGNQHAIQLQPLTGQLLEGNLQLAGQVQWQPEITWDLNLSTQTINPAVQWPESPPASINSHISTQGKLQDNQPIAKINLKQLQGSFNHYPIKGQANIQLKPKQHLTINPLKLSIGDALLSAQGNMDKKLNLDWQLQLPNIQSLYPPAQGSIQAKGRLQGKQQQPILDFDLEAKQLQYQEIQISQLTSNASLDSSDQKPSKLTLNITELNLPQHPPTEITLNTQGYLTQHQIDLSVQQQKNQLQLQLLGSYQLAKQYWQGKIQQLSINNPIAGLWQLQQASPLRLQLQPPQVQLDNLCLQREKTATLCSQAQWQGDTQQAKLGVELQQFPLAWIQAYLPPDLNIKGDIGLNLNARYQDNIPYADLKIIPSAGTINWQFAEEDKTIEYSYQQGLITAKLDQHQLQADVKLPLIKQDVIHAQFQSSSKLIQGDKAVPIQGQLQLSLKQLELVPILVPDIEKFAGEIIGDLKLNGSFANPKITGELAFQQGIIVLPIAGLELNPINAKIIANKDQSLAISASAKSGQGDINMTGKVKLDPKQQFPTRLSIKGERFKAVDLPEYMAEISPKLTINVGKTIDVKGKIKIPAARIEPKTLPKSVEQVSKDEMIIKDNQDAETTIDAPSHLNANIRIILGDYIRVKAFGFKGELLGQIKVQQQGHHAPKANGELQIKTDPVAQFKAYGQDLTIRRGRVYFSGPVNYAGLDMEAVRVSESVTAGVRVSGTTQNPKLTLFSEPHLEQSDILSYLLTGRSFSQLSSKEGSAVNSAAYGAQSFVANMVANRYASKLGIDTVDMEGSQASSMLVLGKYLTPKLYISYGLGLFSSNQLVRLRYDFSKRWAVRLENGVENSGIDLLHIMEFDSIYKSKNQKK